MPDLRDSLTIITGAVTILSIYVTNRIGLSKLQLGQSEIMRQLKAVHLRLDAFGQRLTKVERDHAVLEAVVNERAPNMNIRASQRFKLREEPPILVPGDEDR